MSPSTRDYGFQAFRILQIAFIIAPIIAGADKFIFALVDWSKYISSFALQTMGTHYKEFLMGVGVIEIIVGIGVIFKPKVFAYIVALWLLCIIINLLSLGHYFDIALRDLGLLLAAVALGKLAQKYT